MLYYDRIQISEGIDDAKSNSGKECMVCHYCFFNHGFKIDRLCNGCYDLTMFCFNISYIASITVKGFECRCISHDISKSDAINSLNSLKNFVLEDRGYI